MNSPRLSREEQRAVCEDLLAIERAGRLPAVWSLKHRLLREHRSPSPWEWVEIDLLAGEASRLVGGSPGYWQEAAMAALGIPSRVDLCIEAVCQVADDLKRAGKPAEPAPAEAPIRHRVTVGNRKRGGR